MSHKFSDIALVTLFALSLLLFAISISAENPDSNLIKHIELKDDIVHPKVFGIAEGWWSDGGVIATEFDLENIENSPNQFPYDKIRRERGRIIYFDESKHQSWYYTVKTAEGNRYSIVFSSNGGGSLTISYNVTFELAKRHIKVDGKDREERVMRILEFSMLVPKQEQEQHAL